MLKWTQKTVRLNKHCKSRCPNWYKQGSGCGRVGNVVASPLPYRGVKSKIPWIWNSRWAAYLGYHFGTFRHWPIFFVSDDVIFFSLSGFERGLLVRFCRRRRPVFRLHADVRLDFEHVLALVFVGQNVVGAEAAKGGQHSVHFGVRKYYFRVSYLVHELLSPRMTGAWNNIKNHL